MDVIFEISFLETKCGTSRSTDLLVMPHIIK